MVTVISQIETGGGGGGGGVLTEMEELKTGAFKIKGWGGVAII